MPLGVPWSISLSQFALRRQTSEVRAACSNPARADPCGGRQVNWRPYRDPKKRMASTPVLQSRGFSFATGILRYSRTEGLAANFPERRLNEAPHPGFDLIGSVNTSASTDHYHGLDPAESPVNTSQKYLKF